LLVAAATAIEAGIDFPLLPDLQHEKYTSQTIKVAVNITNNELIKVFL
jgi:hypothetical protein